MLWTRAVRLIEIENRKSWFELARFLNRFIARFFFCAPAPTSRSMQSEPIRTTPKLSARTEQTGTQTDSMLKKQGRWVQNRINACCMQSKRSGERSDHISFRAESVFLKIPLRSLYTLSAARSAQNAPLVIC